jgi:hypothetical protein
MLLLLLCSSSVAVVRTAWRLGGCGGVAREHFVLLLLCCWRWWHAFERYLYYSQFSGRR